ncbi:MAG TPA: aminotransferase class I/II-fold pyridoxal phosphate-dependent enzyme, partial [Gammaproteobacteria bacterium]|nr:aminotransferase class I/II-fold pyridoxal phosphate-dependent enzyme [Gammaproteobacteria bacterium]
PRLTDLGFEVIPSAANFLMIHRPGISAVNLHKELRDRGILVRHFNLPRISGYLRVSIGTDADMRILLDRIREITGPAVGTSDSSLPQGV